MRNHSSHLVHSTGAVTASPVPGREQTEHCSRAAAQCLPHSEHLVSRAGASSGLQHRHCCTVPAGMARENVYATSKYVVVRVHLAVVAPFWPYRVSGGTACRRLQGLARTPNVGPVSWPQEVD